MMEVISMVRGAVLGGLVGELVGEQNTQVAQIISGGSGDNGVAERIEKWIGVEGSECVARFLDAARAGFYSTASSLPYSIDYSI